MKSSEIVLCEICETKEATVFCKNCDKIHIFCERCFTIAHEADNKRLHATQPVCMALISNEKGYFCKEHPKEIKKYACLICSKSVCGECIAFGEHHMHKQGTFKDGIEKAVEFIKQNIAERKRESEKMEDLKEKLATAIDNSIEKLKDIQMKAEINFGILKNIIAEKEVEINKIVHDEIQRLLNDKSEIQKYNESMEKAIDAFNGIIENIIKEPNCKNYDIISKKYEEFQQLETIREKLTKMNEKITYLQGPYTIESLIENVKNVRLIISKSDYDVFNTFIRIFK